MYPIGYQEPIQQAASLSNVDPLLIASVIRVESKFEKGDVSHAGAIGLMQLMPTTAVWIVSEMQKNGETSHYGITSLPNNALAVPETNIRLGSWYLQYLYQQFNGNQVAAIAAYNAGPKRVHQWLDSHTWDGQLRTITEIPVGETRHFVDRVFYNYNLYQRIYGSDPKWKTDSSTQLYAQPLSKSSS